MRVTRVRPLPTRWPLQWAFPDSVVIGRARRTSPGSRVAFLVHGLGMNEDYFAFLADGLLARDYEVWALRLPGYVGAGEPAGTWFPVHHVFSTAFLGWVVASAMAHVVRQADPAPRHMLAWGHSLGAVALANAIGSFAGRDWRGADALVFEAPAFGEALAFPPSILALFTALPAFMLDTFVRAFLLDDLHSSPFARRQGVPFVPGRASRLMLTLNLAGLAHPLNRTPELPRAFRDRCRFIVGEFDRLVDHDRLVRLLDGWGTPPEQRLVLPRNHLLSLTCSGRMLQWLEASGAVETRDAPTV
jgi:hypothetical protein